MIRALAAVLSAPALAVALVATPSAHAEPAGFPDLNAFTEAPANPHFSRPDKWANGYTFFRTPDGLNCIVGSVVQCRGPVPGISPADYGSCAAVFQTYDAYTRSEPFVVERENDCTPGKDGLLDVGQKLTLSGASTTTCVVGRDRLTACIRNGHGFVLQPSGSRVF